MNSQDLDIIKKTVSGKSPQDTIAYLAAVFPRKVVFSTSFGLEDQVITHIIFANNLPVKVFTLDTGRLFSETCSVWNSTREKYGKNIEAYCPNEQAVQKMVSEKGPFSFYESVENRLECCHIRKTEPLQRALKGNKVWITGIRREQSQNRQQMDAVEWDEKNKIVKYHPLLNWNWEEVKRFISENKIPYSPLHDRGFPSIGCQPCTRAVREGEDFRSGRWWWEQTDKKECGLHVK